MQNTIENPQVEVLLDQPRNLVFDFNAMILMEEKLGKPFTEFKKGWVPNFKEIRTLLWAGLQRDYPELTLMDVGKIIPLTRLSDVTSAINKALFISLGGKEDDLKTAPKGESAEGETPATSQAPIQ